jgi:hypothetical protein
MRSTEAQILLTKRIAQDVNALYALTNWISMYNVTYSMRDKENSFPDALTTLSMLYTMHYVRVRAGKRPKNAMFALPVNCPQPPLVHALQK